MKLDMFKKFISKVENENKNLFLSKEKNSGKIYRALLDNLNEEKAGHSKDTGHCKFSRTGVGNGGGHGNVCFSNKL